MAWTLERRLAVVDGATGVVKQSVDPGALGGERDLVYDGGGHRALVFVRDATAPAGEIFAYPVAGEALGPRAHVAWVYGDTRLVPTPVGTAVFTDAGIVRWRLLDDGVETPLVPGPHPMSAWITSTKAGVRLHALAYGPSSGEIDAVETALAKGTLSPPSATPFPASAGTVPPSARIVHAPARGGALLVDVEGAQVTVRSVSGASLGPKASAPLGAPGLRIEAALARDEGREVVLLLSGLTEVVALQIDASLSIASVAAVALPGQPAPATSFLSHDLAPQGPRRFVAATTAGVFSVELGVGPFGVTLALDPAFQGDALRGPVAAIWKAPY